LRQVSVPPYKPHKRSAAKATAEWRRALASAYSYDEMLLLLRVLLKKGLAGDVRAIELILMYGMGKPGVGAAGKLVDDVVADEIEAKRFLNLSPEKQRLYLSLQEEMVGKAISSKGELDTGAPITVESKQESDPGGEACR
jgi:hypothetical protein